MYQAEFSGSSQLLWQHMAFLRVVLDQLRRFFRDIILALDRANLATAEGKALDQLQERLTGLRIEAEINLEEISTSIYDSKREVHVCVKTGVALSPDVQLHIYQILAALCLRYQVNIRTEFFTTKNIGQ